MATRKNALEEERMTDTNISKVIAMLNPIEGADYKAWTKKEACAYLGMAYNTTRLGTIIEKFLAKKELTKKRRAEKRGTAATKDEIVYAIGEYLQGETVDSISKALFRPTTFVKSILDTHAVPIRKAGHSYFDPSLIPEGAVRDRFREGEITYSTKYDSLARIDLEKDDSRYGWIYRVWLLSERQKQAAWQPAYELASLQHLVELGVRL